MRLDHPIARLGAFGAALMAALMAALLGAPLAAASPAGDAALGFWRVQSGRGVVEIRRCGGSICGTIVAGAGAALDTENDDPALRNRPLIGLIMLSGDRETARGWVSGRIYNPDDGGAYRSEITPGPRGALLVKGCFGPLCRTQTWTRSPE